VTPASQAFMTTSNPAVEAERRHAFRALLRNPLLLATGKTAEEYVLVRRHSEWLKHWLDRFPAWSLHIDREVARLRKRPADFLDDTRPAIDRASGTTFTRRRYALLCLALASLEQLGPQTTLDQVAQKITELIATDRELQAAGLLFDVGHYDQRRDLVHAIRLLIETGVLSRLDGDEQRFLDRSESSDVLYDIHRRILTSILHLSQSPSAMEAVRRSPTDSLAERVAKLGDDPSIRSRLVRALLDDPILYFHDLNDEERHYLEKHRSYLLRQISEATGLIAEVRAEGIAMVDDAGDLTDINLPDSGTDAHLDLLLVQWFAECSRNGTETAIPLSAVEQHVRETGAEPRLMEDALVRLRALRLIQMTSGGVVPLAACGRYKEE